MSSTCSTTLEIIIQRSVYCNRVELCVLIGASTEAQMNQYSASTSDIKTIE